MRFPILFLISMLFLSYGCSPDGGTEADHAIDEIEFRLKRSIAATEDLIYWYAENDWNTEELERQLFEKIDKLITLSLENGWDMSEIEVKLANLERLLESL